MFRGLKAMGLAGTSPRALLFLAFDGQGDVQLAVADQGDDVSGLRVGEKLALPWPFAGRVFYLDSLHPLSSKVSIVNGDRRIGGLASLIDVAAMLSRFVQRAGAPSVFFGCTPHQPGSWWTDEKRVIALHERGMVGIVRAAGLGLIARRTVDDGLYFLPLDDALACKVDHWTRVFTSPLGNILLLERRLCGKRLMLSCQRGLVEVALDDLPRVHEVGRIDSVAGHAVVGRVSADGAYAVARGVPTDWGLDELTPATLVRPRGESLEELARALREMEASSAD
ncbi:MAG: hypothetical protein KC503_19890 [Myxococcales bacterium]|nr:hypothetical protein [Myxococcales bacterium]